MAHLLFLLFELLFIINLIKCESNNLSENIQLDLYNLIQRNGYFVEYHEIETKDGYILGTYRIPFTNSTQKNIKRTPVILIHGILGSAADFVLLGPHKALAYYLAENGYDVWIGNSRGNLYSRKHKSLDPNKDKTFWQFSFHEQGLYDVPATIDYVLNVTNAQKISFVGFSQGGMAFFVMCSERPEYMEKVNIMISMASPAFFENFQHYILTNIAQYYRFADITTNALGLRELNFMLPLNLYQRVIRFVCESSLVPLCRLFLYLFVGVGSQQIEDKLIPNIAMHLAGGSVPQFLHVNQIAHQHEFRKFDKGVRENKILYGSNQPPEYNLKNINIPVALFYGDGDELVSEQDTLKLSKILPNVVKTYKVPVKEWGHLEFIYAKSANKVLYPEILKVMNKYL